MNKIELILNYQKGKDCQKTLDFNKMIRIHSEDKDLKNLIDYNTNYPYFYLYKDNLFTGIVFDTNEKGIVQEELMFRDGKLHGTLKEWDNEGKLISKECFKNGMQHGEQKKWFEGELIEHSIFKENKFIEEKSWHLGGKIASITNQKESKEWNEEGNLIKYSIQLEKKEISETYFKTEKIKTRNIRYNKSINSEYSEWNEASILIKYKEVRNQIKKEENKFIKKLNYELNLKKVSKSCYFTFIQEFYGCGKLRKEYIQTHCSVNTLCFIPIKFKEWDKNGNLINSSQELQTSTDKPYNKYNSFFIKAQKLNPFVFSK